MYLISAALFLLSLLGEYSLAHDVRNQEGNILQVCEKAGALTFVKYARATPWVNKTLVSGIGYMALAPTDRAFGDLPLVVKIALKDPQTLEWYLRYHIALSVAYKQEINNNLRIPSAFRPPGKTEDLPEPVLPIRFNVYDVLADYLSDGSFGQVVTAGGAPIVQADLPASNGIVHIIDKVMFPLPTGADMTEFVNDDGRFSSLFGFLQTANLTKALETDPSRPLTLFAPNNQAFKNLPKSVVQKLANVTFLQQVLEYHVVPGAYYAAGLWDNQILHPLYNKPLLVERGQGGIYLQNSKVLQADNTVSNGVVHEISAVLIPPKVSVHVKMHTNVENHNTFLSVWEVRFCTKNMYSIPAALFLLSLLGEHSLAFHRYFGGSVVEVCEDAGVMTFVKYIRAIPWLNETLENHLLYMVLAPTDRAFEDLGVIAPEVKTALKDPETLERYIRFHITMSDVVFMEEIYNERMLTSLPAHPERTEGVVQPLLPFRFNVYHVPAYRLRKGVIGRVVTVNGAPIVRSDLPAWNGLVHILDKVMLLPTGANMTKFVNDDGRFSRLVGFLQAANLTEALETEPSQPLTLFAPNNRAFENLPNNVVQKLANVTFLKQVLEYHLVRGTYYEAGLWIIETLQPFYNKTLPVRRGTWGTHVQNSLVLQGDNTVSNGVVHEISAVLIPPE
ncbi:transforming growth factor-beta-induced protein ig-h3-like [Acanthaster planci]|uniref:Transforming growth factor-beta-induced protein ig-h3-like n=1 Tax=Acanthaster planci TaxID=133434 RepID=A0A8B7XPF2_ACAPL|nr:transforming growth factor-beta-induced protein ig-h3-like [Acanthaster planci]